MDKGIRLFAEGGTGARADWRNGLRFRNDAHPEGEAMNTFTKVMVVVNFVLAVAFTFASLTLFAKEANWVDEAGKLVESRNRLNQELIQTRTLLDNTRTELTAELNAQKELVQNLTATAEERAGQIADITTTRDEAMSQVNSFGVTAKAFEATLDNLREQVQKEQSTVSDLRKEVARLQSISENAVKTATETMTDLTELQGQHLELAKLNQRLMVEVEASNRALAAAGIVVDPSRGRGISSIVQRVSLEERIVVLGAGERDRVKTGMVFVISRNGNYLGKVLVTRVYDDMAAAVILADLTPDPAMIREGDRAEVM